MEVATPFSSTRVPTTTPEATSAPFSTPNHLTVKVPSKTPCSREKAWIGNLKGASAEAGAAPATQRARTTATVAISFFMGFTPQRRVKAEGDARPVVPSRRRGSATPDKARRVPQRGESEVQVAESAA